ncbi:MAG: hypothetical protein HY22_04710 [[Candidatus Thermochlorobacteriaceae] bacterium GBChlB]|nr:MAG: hypothetical protein HY22_04710 [[Candidatus Thermochlorobacteriaceae] bacterium GBChlB]
MRRSGHLFALLVFTSAVLAACATVPPVYRYEPATPPDSIATAKDTIMLEDERAFIFLTFGRVDEPNVVFQLGVMNRGNDTLLVVPEFFYYKIFGDEKSRLLYAQSADDVIERIDETIEEIKSELSLAQSVSTASSMMFAQQLREDLTRLAMLRAEVEKEAWRETALAPQAKAFGKLYFPFSKKASKIELSLLVGTERHRVVFTRKELAEPVLSAPMLQRVRR